MEKKRGDVRLSELLKFSDITQPPQPDPLVTGLSYDTRSLKQGDLYFAVPGATFDGHDFVGEAEKKGASGAVVQRTVSCGLPLIKVPSVMKAMSRLAHEFYGRPSCHLPVVGVTGTNGKTTVTFLIESILKKAGKKAGVLGTVNYRFGSEMWPAPNTTPMAVDIHRFCASLREKRADAMVMEVSSHALDLGRVADVRFTCGVFTNLTQDHLDYHKTMEAYFHAKETLFKLGDAVKPVINVDDEYGKKLIDRYPSALAFGFGAEAAVRATHATCDLNGVSFRLRLPSGKTADVGSKLLGQHNISNILAAVGAVSSLGLSDDRIIEGLAVDASVPGRLERIEAGQNFVVVVDYAHTPDALEKVLVALRETRPKRVICVFGAGGDRDRKKRPIMGRISAENADFAVITSDNPRTEDPARILKDVEDGVKSVRSARYEVIENRREAIRRALGDAKAGDIVLIAGKGHEDYQIYGTTKHHFSDREVALDILKHALAN